MMLIRNPAMVAGIVLALCAQPAFADEAESKDQPAKETAKAKNIIEHLELKLFIKIIRI